MAQEYTYDIKVSGDEVWGQVWWDPAENKIATDTPELLEYLKTKHHQDITYHDGVKFLTHLGNILSNGYIHAERVED